MTLGAESARLEKRSLRCDTSLIDILTRLDVIKGVRYYRGCLKECVSEDVRCSFTDLVKSGDNVTL